MPLLSKLPSTSYVSDGIYEAIILKDCEDCRTEKGINGYIESAVTCVGLSKVG